MLVFAEHTIPILSDAAMLLVASQVEMILTFFLSRNMRIARDRAWAQTVESRGKGQEFWQPYVEEWSVPPRVLVDTPWSRFAKKYLGGPLAVFFVKKGTAVCSAYHNLSQNNNI